jgi:DUF177 domain-containing protein
MLTFFWDAIKGNGISLDQRVKISSLSELQALEEGGECHFLAPLEVKLQVFPAGDLVELTGAFKTAIEASCCRCLTRFTLELAADIELTLAKELPSVTDEDGTDVELSADEMGLILVAGDEIDLSSLISEQVIMALPYRVLCDERCKGVCASCGADLNQQDCQCHPEKVLNKFAALKDFKIKH